MRRKLGRNAALVGVLLAGAAACSKHEGAAATATAAPDAAGDAGAASAAPLVTPITNAANIALHNLDGEIATYVPKADAGDIVSAYIVIERYLMRAQFEGRVSDLGAAEEASAKLLARTGEAKAHLARAHALGGLHRFNAALAELDEAARLGAPADEVRQARGPLFMGMGKYDEAAPLMPSADSLLPADLIIRGAFLERTGHPAEGDQAFELARTRYRDTSPFAVAWMDFERARILEREGNTARARLYLEEAATVLPSYTHAVVHLAAMEPPERALARLQALEATSDNPDMLAATADALRRGGRANEAQAMAGRAKARFEEVLQRWPEAFADHAASFFLGMGHDPARALALAKQNVALRPTDEAIELWLTAAEAVDAHAEACEAVARGKALAYAAPPIRARLEVAARACR